ncbi:MAG TPA: hypothetical protein PKE69_04290 [Pyrinomonadaceae bacterium]|nr:hypothetical protein [Pyrinomonadaceae bacterium]
MFQKGVQILAVLLFATTLIFSQSKIKELNISGGCNYGGGELDTKVYSFEGDKAATEAVDRILEPVGLERNFEIRAADVSNAAAVIVGETRYLLYNQAFIRRVKDVTKTDWSAISIMAHEVGHHLNGHTLIPGGSRPPTELEADSFSGFVLYKLGATIEEAQAAMNAIAGEKGSATHPPKRARLAAIESGWTKAKDQDKSTTNENKPKETPTISNESNKLVGTWTGEVTESGYVQKILWQNFKDGTYKIWFSNPYGSPYYQEGTFSLRNGILTQQSSNSFPQEISSGEIEWVTDNHIKLTIINNANGSASRGRTRHYFRQK